MNEPASDVIAGVIDEHIQALALMIRALANESEKSAKRGNGGKLFGQTLGMLILVATFIGESQQVQLPTLKAWIPFAIGIMGVLVTVTGQYMNPESRIKLAQACSDLASKIRLLRNKVRVDIVSIDGTDESKMRALLEELQESEKAIFQDARSAGISTNISLILDQKFAARPITTFQKLTGS